jgi:DNA-binding CsgD family transcriptional regulator
MLFKTKNGYGFGSYESIPGTPILERKLSNKEAAAVLYKVNGYTYEGAAEQMHCSEKNVSNRWQSIYFKLGINGPNCSEIALLELMRLGALRFLMLCLLILSSGAQSINPFNDSDINRPLRARQMRTRNGKNSKLAINNHLLLTLIGLTASELYSENDLKAMFLNQSPA